jgi:iron complex outermembrane receptor protein
MMDVERVEVLRGPQGTLYGRNATGGVVNVVMVQPKDYFEFSGKVGYGNFNARNLQGVVNVPVNSKLAMRVAAAVEKRDVYIKGTPLPYFHESSAYRVKARYNLHEDITLTGTMSYGAVEETPLHIYMIPMSNMSTDDPWWNPNAFTTYDRVNEKQTWNYNFQFDWNIGDWTVLTFIPTVIYNERVSRGSQVEGLFDMMGSDEQTQYSYEARFANPADSELIWVLGGFYFDSESPKTQGISVSPTPTAQLLQRPTGSWALFGQLTYPFTDSLRIVGGLRYAYDDRSSLYRIYQTNNPAEGEDLVLVYDTGELEREYISKEPTYKLGLEYDIAEDSMVYIQAASGYKAGGTSISRQVSDDLGLTALEATQYDPEESLNFELGSKNRFLDNRLQINGSLFYTVYDSAQAQFPIMLDEGTDEEQMIMQVVNA